MLLISKYFIKINIKIISVVKKVIAILFYPIIYLVKTIKRLLFKPIKFITINVQKIYINRSKKIKNIIKNKKEEATKTT
jgi:hypothetical protein